MLVYKNPKSGDTWNFSFNHNTLGFTFSFSGKEHKNIHDYRVAHNGIGMPLIVTKYNYYQLNVYLWLSNQWTLKKLHFVGSITNYFVSKIDNDQCHLLIETASGSNREVHHFFTKDNKWSSKTFPIPNCKIYDLIFLSKEHLLFLTVFCNKNRLLSIYGWNEKTQKWEEAGFNFHIPTGMILAVGYTKNLVHLLALVKDHYYKLNYTEFNRKNNSSKESSIIMLPAFFPIKCHLIQDSNIMAIFFTSYKSGYFFYSKDGSKWLESSISQISSYKNIASVYTTTGYISSSLAFNELFNIELKTPLILKASNIIKLSQNHTGF